MTVYRCDDAYFDHAKIATPDRQPTFHLLVNLDTDGLWLRPDPQQISEEIKLYREEFPMIIADLHALPDDRPIIAEGVALMPKLVAPLVRSPH